MKAQINIFNIFLIVLTLGLLGVLLYSVNTYTNNQEIIINEIKKIDYNNDAGFLILAQQKFADNHKYNVTTYNCVNYSVNFQKVMSELGYNISTETGYNNKSGHMWNKMCFDYDPQDGTTNSRELFPNRYD